MWQVSQEGSRRFGSEGGCTIRIDNRAAKPRWTWENQESLLVHADDMGEEIHE